MNKSLYKMLSVAAFMAAGAFTACSDDGGSDPTKAELCATGLSAECLIGEWNAEGIANGSSLAMYPNFDYKAAPGKFTFLKDGSFQFDVPANAPVDLRGSDCTPIFGTWTIAGATIEMRANVNGACLPSKSAFPRATITPKISVEGAVVKMVTDLWFMENYTDEIDIRNNGVEIYTISAN